MALRYYICLTSPLFSSRSSLLHFLCWSAELLKSEGGLQPGKDGGPQRWEHALHFLVVTRKEGQTYKWVWCYLYQQAYVFPTKWHNASAEWCLRLARAHPLPHTRRLQLTPQQQLAAINKGPWGALWLEHNQIGRWSEPIYLLPWQQGWVKIRTQ